MVRKTVLLILACCGLAKADTGYPSTIRVTETDNSPACTIGQIKVTPGTLSCSGQTATITTGGGGGTGGVSVYPATATASFPFGFSASTFTATAVNASVSSVTVTGASGLTVVSTVTALSFASNGPGAGQIQLTEGSSTTVVALIAPGKGVIWIEISSNTMQFNVNAGSTYTILSASTTITPGHFLVMGPALTAVDGGTGSGGAGTPGAPVNSVQYNSASAFAGSANFNYSGSSLTVLNPVNISGAVIIGTNSAVATVQSAQQNIVATGATTNIVCFSTSATGPCSVSVSTAAPIAPSDYRLTISSPPTGVTTFGVQYDGHLISSGTAPVLTSCGTGPLIDGTDAAGTVTGGTGSTGCTITFAEPYGTDPHCTVTEQTMSLVNAFGYTHSASNIVVTQTGLGTGKFDYTCFGKQ